MGLCLPVGAGTSPSAEGGGCAVGAAHPDLGTAADLVVGVLPCQGKGRRVGFGGATTDPSPEPWASNPKSSDANPGRGGLMVRVPRGRGATEGTSRLGMGSSPAAPPPPQAVLSPSGPIPGCGEGAVPRSPTATRDREEAPGGGPGAQPELGTACPLTDPTLPGRPLQPGTGVLSRFTRSRLHALKRIPGWGRTSPVPTPRGRGGVVVTGPSSPPRRSKPGPSRTPGAAAPLISPPPRCILPQTPTLLFCKSPEIFMALRRAPLNEFLIKTLSGSQSTPPHTPAVEGGRRPGPPRYRGELEEPGPAPRAFYRGRE